MNKLIACLLVVAVATVYHSDAADASDAGMQSNNGATILLMRVNPSPQGNSYGQQMQQTSYSQHVPVATSYSQQQVGSVGSFGQQHQQVPAGSFGQQVSASSYSQQVPMSSYSSQVQQVAASEGNSDFGVQSQEGYGGGQGRSVAEFGNQVGGGESADYGSQAAASNYGGHAGFGFGGEGGHGGFGASGGGHGGFGSSGGGHGGFGVSGGGHGGDDNHKQVTIEKPYPVPIVKIIRIPVAQPIPVAVPHPVAVPVPQPQPIYVKVPQKYEVPVFRAVQVPVEKQVPYTVEKHVPQYIEKPFPIHINKHYTVSVPKPYPVHIPVIKHVYHSAKSHGGEHH